MKEAGGNIVEFNAFLRDFIFVALLFYPIIRVF
jgi:hypothetical protein